jgi:MFS family permease
MHADRVLTRPFALTMLVEFALCVSVGMLLAVVPVYADDELDVGSFGVAVAVAAVSPMVLLCQPLAGRYADRNGRRILIVAGGLLTAFAVAGYVVADSLPVLVVLRLLTGAGEAMVLVGAATMVTDIAPVRRRGEALSIFSLGLWGGLALGPFVGELVLDASGYDLVWLLAASFCLASVLIGFLLPETAPSREPETMYDSRLMHRAAIGPGLVLAFTVLGFAGLATFGALYARDLGLEGGGAVFLVFSAVVVATRVFARQAPDRLGPKRTGRIALTLIATGLFTIGIWSVPAGLFLGTVIVAFGHALAFPSLMTLAVNAAPAGERSSVVGTFSAFTELGFLVGALTLGAIASELGYSGVFVVCAFGPLLGVLLLSRLTAPRIEPVPDPA